MLTRWKSRVSDYRVRARDNSFVIEQLIIIRIGVTTREVMFVKTQDSKT